jgi:hypothetical protein
MACRVGCCHVVWQNLTDVSEALTAFVMKVPMMEAVSTSETSVKLYQTTRSMIPEDSRYNLKSQFG